MIRVDSGTWSIAEVLSSAGGRSSVTATASGSAASSGTCRRSAAASFR